MEKILEVKNIEKYYGNKSNLTKAIDNINFDVNKGEFVGIMGASGSGKTTLLNCISTIDRVTAGHIIINGEDITKLKGNNLNKFRREELGFIFQDFNLLDTLTAYENIALALTIQKVKANEIDRRVNEIAEKLGIKEILKKYPYQVSGGQKQRIASARAIITNPKLILADEPTGALDSKAARQLLENFELLNQKMNATILMVTHDAFTASYANRILFIKDGNNVLNIVGKQYKSKYNECKTGYIQMSTNHTNTGIVLVPDDCNLTEDMKKQYLLAANYNSDTKEGKEEIEKIFVDNNSELLQNLEKNGLNIDGRSKISIMESSIGLATIVTFIAIYLGIIFLIASSAILALKQLTDSSDNKQRYTILRKIGCDEKMINKALFRQIGIFFGVPLVLAIIHSIFGIQFAITIMSGLASKKDLLPSAIATVIIIGIIYGIYFLATYLGSKNIIKEDE